MNTTNSDTTNSDSRHNWIQICSIDDIVPNAGRCALVNGDQVAIFRIRQDGEDRVFAIHNHDPFSNANVLSRGITGSVDQRLVVASPLYKQHFCLQSGQCLEQQDVSIKTWPVKIENNAVLLAA